MFEDVNILVLNFLCVLGVFGVIVIFGVFMIELLCEWGGEWVLEGIEVLNCMFDLLDLFLLIYFKVLICVMLVVIVIR